MRTATSLFLLAVITVGSEHVFAVAQPDRLDRLLPPFMRVPDLTESVCQVWPVVLQIARRAELPIGFEVVPECSAGTWPTSVPDGPLVLDGLSVRAAFDLLTVRQPGYRWAEVAGTPVFRPREAWDDPASVLSMGARPFVLSSAGLHDTLHAALQAADPALARPHTHAGPAGSRRPMRFDGGSLLQALTAIAVERRAIWQFGNVGENTTVVIEPLNGETSGEIAVLRTREP